MQINQAGIDFIKRNALQTMDILQHGADWAQWYSAWAANVWTKHAARCNEFNARWPNCGNLPYGDYVWYINNYSTGWSSHASKDLVFHFTARKFDWGRGDPPACPPLFVVEGVNVTFSITVKEEDWQYVMKDGIVFIPSDEAWFDLVDLQDFTRACFSDLPKDHTRISVPQMREKSRAWHARTAKAKLPETVRNPEMERVGELPVLFLEGDSKTTADFVKRELVLYELKNADALADESERMSNCVRTYEPERAAGNCRIFSARGESRDQGYTIETDYLMQLKQIRGFANRTLPPWEYSTLLHALGMFGFAPPPKRKVRDPNMY